MLAQADGICMDMVSAMLFKKKGKKQLENQLRTFPARDGITDLLLQCLYSETALNQDTNTRDANVKEIRSTARLTVMVFSRFRY